LCVVDAPGPTSTAGHGGVLEAAILERLSSGRPYTTLELRDLLKIRKATLIDALDKLRAEKLVVRAPTGWSLARESNQLELSEPAGEPHDPHSR